MLRVALLVPDGFATFSFAPLAAQRLALERNLFLKLCITETAIARMRSYEEENITSPSRSIVVKQGA
jgi:hypothetical protein